MRRIILLLLGLLLTLTAHGQTNQERTGLLTGRVTEAGTEVPMPGVNVVVEGTTHGAATGPDGRYRVGPVPVGTYAVRFSMIGYAPVVRTGVAVTSGTMGHLSVTLSPTVIESGSVEVVADYFAQQPASPVSARALHHEEIRRAPGAAADVQRVMQAMPGVTFSDDHRNDLIVRGGSPTENLTLVDDIEVPNINHFGTQGATGGPISMLNADFLDGVTFLTGGFPAEYGGKLSSVLDVRLREGNPERMAASMELSMAGAGGSIEGPLPTEGHGTWFVGGRRSYLDLINEAMDLTAVPQYSSGQAKLVYEPTPQDQLTAVGLAGVDAIHFERDMESEELDSEYDSETNGSTTVAGLSWRRTWSTRGYTRLTVSSVRSTFDVVAHDSLDALVYRNRSREHDAALRLTSGWQFGHGTLDAGASVHRTGYRHDIFLQGSEDRTGQPQPDLDEDETASPLRTALYVQYAQPFASSLTVTGGLRLETFSLLDEGTTLSPRLAARWRLTPRLALNGAWGIYRQTPSLIWFTSSETTRALRPTRADHYVVGLELRPRPEWQVTLEAYAKRYDHVATFVEMPMLSTINEGADYGAALVASPLSGDGTAHAEGLELFAQRRMTSHWYLTAAYSLSRARYTPLDGQERPTNFDMRHVATLILGTRDLPIGWLGRTGGSVKLRYASGRPYTPYDLAASRALDTGVIDTERVNAERMPDYLRLDLRVDRRSHFGWGSITSYFELQNALGRRNVAQRVYNRRIDDVEEFTHWGRFFVGGVVVEL